MAFFFEGDPDTWISVGSLDHPEDWPMTTRASWGQSMHVFIDTKIPWYEISDGPPQRESDVLSEAARAYVARSSQYRSLDAIFADNRAYLSSAPVSASGRVYMAASAL